MFNGLKSWVAFLNYKKFILTSFLNLLLRKLLQVKTLASSSVTTFSATSTELVDLSLVINSQVLIIYDSWDFKSFESLSYLRVNVLELGPVILKFYYNG